MLLVAPPVPQDVGELSAFGLAIDRAERALAAGQLEQAYALVIRALERDRKDTLAWDLRARWARAAEDRDDEVYSRHQQYRLSLAQGV